MRQLKSKTLSKWPLSYVKGLLNLPKKWKVPVPSEKKKSTVKDLGWPKRVLSGTLFSKTQTNLDLDPAANP